MQPDIYAHKPRQRGKRGALDTPLDTPIERDVEGAPERLDGVSGVLGVSESESESESGSDSRGGTTPAPQSDNSGPVSSSRQPDSQPLRGEIASSSSPSRPADLRHITADRPIFTLSVAADLLGLHPRTLSIYEEKGLVVPARTGGNRRRYSQADIEKFQAIRLLTRGGVNLEGVRIILDMAQELSRLGSDPTAIIERNLQTSDT